MPSAVVARHATLTSMQNPQTTPEPQPGHLTTRQVADILRVHPETARRNARRLGGGKTLGRYRYDPAAVAAAATGGAA